MFCIGFSTDDKLIQLEIYTQWLCGSSFERKRKLQKDQQKWPHNFCPPDFWPSQNFKCRNIMTGVNSLYEMVHFFNKITIVNVKYKNIF